MDKKIKKYEEIIDKLNQEKKELENNISSLETNINLRVIEYEIDKNALNEEISNKKSELN